MTRDVYITDVAAFLPNGPVSNDEMEQVLGTVNGRRSRARPLVLRNNGIKQRYYAIDKDSGELRYNNACLTAEAIRRLKLEPAKIELLSCGTSSPDQLMPNHGVMVHGELDAGVCEVHSSAGICTAGMAALKYAWLSVMSGGCDNAVATGSELASTFMQSKNFECESEARVRELEQRPEVAFEKDFLRWMLSDGAGAMLLQGSPAAEGLSLRIEWIELHSYAHTQPACMYGGAEKNEDGTLRGWREFDSMEEVLKRSVLTVKQDVKQLNEEIVRVTVEQALPGIAEKHGLEAESVDYFLPHISSEYFRSRLAEGLERIGFAIPQARWFTNLTHKGNTGSASIYIILEELFHSGRLQKGERILCFVPESGRFSTSFMLLTVV
ncbi:MAG: beta-ketoacyl-ACP synthase III [Pseudomonadota bacterium]